MESLDALLATLTELHVPATSIEKITTKCLELNYDSTSLLLESYELSADDLRKDLTPGLFLHVKKALEKIRNSGNPSSFPLQQPQAPTVAAFGKPLFTYFGILHIFFDKFRNVGKWNEWIHQFCTAIKRKGTASIHIIRNVSKTDTRRNKNYGRVAKHVCIDKEWISHLCGMLASDFYNIDW